MERIIISWIGWYKDFTDPPEEAPNPDGPLFELHRRFYGQQVKHHKHIILSPEVDGESGYKSMALFSALKKSFRTHQIEIRFLALKDILDYQEVKGKMEHVLNDLKDYEIDILYSNGTTPIRTAWVLLHLEERFNTHLIQGLDARMTQDEPSFKEIILDKQVFPYRLEARIEDLNRPAEHEELLVTQKLLPVYGRAEKIALAHDPRVTTLIRGESGTGKELLARHIHNHSSRKNEAFIAVNCTAVPDNLIESQLFGHEKGSFTGADKRHYGFFAQANKGTIFLDEIGDASNLLQQKLLRVLQEQKIMPIGLKEEKIDVRVIAATNRNLEQMCEEGQFRWDLYWRLNISELELPVLSAYPIAERKQYIQSMLKHKAYRAKRKKLRLSSDLEDWLLTYRFPGNFREMENIITYFYVIAEVDEVGLEDLPPYAIRRKNQTSSLKLEDVEKAHIQKVLDMFDGNQTRASQALGIALNTLKRKKKIFGI